LELTPDQQQAARTCGIAFFPATEAQVQRLTMQKRIFRLCGKPFMATRDGGFWETHGTFLKIIEEHAGKAPRQSSEALKGLPQPEQAPLSNTIPPSPVQEAAEPPSRDAKTPEEIARTQARPPRRRRTGAKVALSHERDKAAGGGTETARVEHAIVDAPVVAEAPGEAPAEAGDQSDSTVRRSRTRQPMATRSAPAGKERHGRLK
jgi:hypothetical protein